MTWLLCAIYGYLALVSLSNLALMRRPRQPSSVDGLPEVAVLIPARDEASNLQRLVPALIGPNPGLKVYVYDDDSSDATAEVAASAGAIVLKGGPLPDGWTGKNRACCILGLSALEDSDAEWLMFLDADVYPEPGFVPACRAMARTLRPRVGVLTAFPRLIPGRLPQPLFLAWVGWLLVATNPFGLTARTGMGHNQFTNGQFTLWRRSVWAELKPNEAVKSAVLEDVLIGRLLKKHAIGLEVAIFSKFLAVKMYETWRETVDGMSKNSYEITGNTAGSFAVALFLLLLGWAWLAVPLWWAPAALLGLSALGVTLLFESFPLAFFTVPIWLTIGSFTVLRSIYWRRKGRVTWKGRTYPS